MSAPGDGGSRKAPPDRGADAAAHADTVLRRLRVRVPLMGLAMLALLSALAGGLARLGWPLPVARLPGARADDPGIVAWRPPATSAFFHPGAK